jgi:hypothetical protein
MSLLRRRARAKSSQLRRKRQPTGKTWLLDNQTVMEREQGSLSIHCARRMAVARSGWKTAMFLNKQFAALALAAFVALGASAAQASVVYTFNVDTSSLPAGTQGYIDMQFSGAVALGPNAYNQLGTATVSNFQSVGGFFTQADPYTANDFPGGNVTGNVSGILPNAVTFDVNGDGAINEYTHSFQFGSSFSFQLTLAGQGLDAPSCPNTGGSDCTVPGFTLDLLNATGTGFLLTGDPNGETGLEWTLGQVNFNTDGTTSPVIYPGPGGGASVLTITPVTAVPEPSAWALMLAGFGALGVALRRRRATLAAA